MKIQKTVDEYINSFTPDIRERLSLLRGLIKKLAPAVEEKIAWGMPGYKLNGKPLIYFAGFKKHIGIYPLPETIDELKNDLANYKQGKGSVQFPHDEPLPLGLIKKIIISRVDKFKSSRGE